MSEAFPVPALAQLYRTAFVTGASSGLGRAFLVMLAGEGVKVWATARDRGRVLQPADAALAGRVTPVALDLADPDGAEAAFARAAGEAGGCLDLVINNAGYGIFGEFPAVPAADWERQVAGMLGTSLRLSHAAWRAWLRTIAADPGAASRPRCLVNVSSLAAEFPLPFMAGYNAAKAGLSALSESLALEGRRAGIRVVDFRPGDYRTSFNDAMRRTAAPPPVDAVWRALERNLRGAPPPDRAAEDLRRALAAGRVGTVRSGTLFQAGVAPLLARCVPQAWQRAVSARYFGLR